MPNCGSLPQPAQDKPRLFVTEPQPSHLGRWQVHGIVHLSFWFLPSRQGWPQRAGLWNGWPPIVGIEVLELGYMALHRAFSWQGSSRSWRASDQKFNRVWRQKLCRGRGPSPLCLAVGFPGSFVMMWLPRVVRFVDCVGEVWSCLQLPALALEMGIFLPGWREVRWLRLLVVHSHSPGGCAGEQHCVPNKPRISRTSKYLICVAEISCLKSIRRKAPLEVGWPWERALVLLMSPMTPDIFAFPQTPASGVMQLHGSSALIYIYIYIEREREEMGNDSQPVNC